MAKKKQAVAVKPRAVALSNLTPGRLYGVEQLLTGAEVAAEYESRQADLDAQFVRARKVLKKWLPKIRKSEAYQRGYITGVSVGFRSRCSETVSPLQVVIAINVARKHSDGKLNCANVNWENLGVRDQIPPVLSGVPVKVLEGGFELLAPAFAGQFLRGSSTAPHDPLGFGVDLVGGAAIAKPGASSDYGTLGVVFRGPAGNPLGLTCKHVMDGIAAVEQVGPIVGGVPTTRGIGTVLSSSNKKQKLNGVTERVDCASVTLNPPPPITYRATDNGWIRGVNTPGGELAGLQLFFSGRRVLQSDDAYTAWKFGAATGEVISGHILHVDLPVFTIGGLDYQNNFSVKGDNDFLLPGDSGSIIALEAKVNGHPALVAVGILFAQVSNSFRVGLACNMGNVIEALSLPVPAARIVTDWQRLP